MQKRFFLNVLLAFATLVAPVHGQTSSAWRDPSPHAIRFVQVDASVRLEVLDWHGSGRPVVLLAGLGNTAHVFDEFAPRLTRDYHVYGVTRRGFGASTIAESGYEADRLGDDLVRVLDALELRRPVLVGHSLAGEEMSSIGTRDPSRIAGLVYLDAGYEYAFDSAPARQLQEETRKRLQTVPPPRQPGPRELETFAALRAWQIQTYGFGQPESELRQCCESATSPAKNRTPPTVTEAILKGAQRYSAVRVPVLAIFASPHDYDTWWPEKTPAVEAVLDWERAATEEVIEAFRSGIPSATIVRLPRASHYLFLSHESDVLKEVRAFLNRLR